MTPVITAYQWKNNSIYIKREDMIPYSFGGNKARKAQFFFNEIDAGDYNAVVTYGSSSSNHCRIVANMAAERGIPCYIIGPSEASHCTFNKRLMEWFGAKIIYVPVEEVHNTIENKMKELLAQNYNPYFIAGGGHGNLGTQAYVECYEEIVEYERENNINFDYIFFASGTGTTQAGLVCGQLMNQDKKKIVGISIARKNPRGRQVVIDSINEYFQAKHISYKQEAVEKATMFIDDFTGDGYGCENEKIAQTIQTMMIKSGIPMDATYTAKAYAGMCDYLEENSITNKNILFIHTGGTPLFFDELLK